MPDRVTVFGGTGYLGRGIVRQLESAGVSQVRVAVRRPSRARDLFAGGVVEPVRADVTEAGTVTRAVDGAQAVVNAVSLYVQTRNVSFADIHVDGARRVAAAARESGAALVHISGVGSDPRSSQRYIRARGLGESAVRDRHRAAVILRPTVLFSAHGGLVEQVLRVLRHAPVFPLFGRGGTRLQPVHRDDAARAVSRLLESQADGHDAEILECGGPEVKSYRAFVEQIGGAAGLSTRLVPVPFSLWHAVGLVTERLPGAPLTRDQVALMREGSVAAKSLPGLADLGIEPQAMRCALQSRFATGAR